MAYGAKEWIEVVYFICSNTLKSPVKAVFTAAQCWILNFSIVKFTDELPAPALAQL